MRQLLGQYSVNWNGRIRLDFENKKLLLPDTRDIVDQHYDGLKNVISSTYSGVVEEEADDYTQLRFGFTASGSEYIFRKSLAGLEMIVKQPIYHTTLGENFSKRSYLLVPYFDGSAVDIESLNALVKIECNFRTIVDHAIEPSSFVKEEVFDILNPFSLKLLNVLKLYFRKCYKSGCIEDFLTEENFFFGYEPQQVNWDVVSSLNSSFQFFEELISFTWSKRAESLIFPVLKVKTVLTTANTVDEITEDNSIQGEKDLTFSLESQNSASLLEQIGLLEALKDWADFKVLEQTSSISPLYKVDGVLEELRPFVGQVGFVVDRGELKYQVITLVDAKEDEDGNLIAQLDNYVPFGLDNAFLIFGVPVDYSARFDQQTFASDTTEESEALIISGANYRSIQISGSIKLNFIDKISNVVTNSLTSDGKSLKDAVPSLYKIFQSIELYPSTVILSLPLLPISQEDYNVSMPELNPLDYDLIDDMGQVGLLKPTYVATPHPSGDGYIVAAQIPNYYALKIRDKLNYAPAKIFVVDEPDKALTTGAYLGTKVGSEGDYDFYLILGKVTAAAKPFKVVGF